MLLNNKFIYFNINIICLRYLRMIGNNYGFLTCFEWGDYSQIFVEDLCVNRLTADSNGRSMSEKINRGFYWGSAYEEVDQKFKLKIYEWQDQSWIFVKDLYMSRLIKSWPQIQIEDLWVTRSIANFCFGFAYEQVDQSLTADSN